MCRKFAFLTALLVIAGATVPAWAGFELKVDLASPTYPVKTAKPGWNIWASGAWANEDRHDPQYITNIGGSGINAVITTVAGENGALIRSLSEGGQDVEPICNTFYRQYEADNSSINLLFYGDGLTAGMYTIKTYHRDPAGRPGMPSITATVNDDGRFDGIAPVGVGDVEQYPTGEGNDVNVGIPGDPIVDSQLTPSIVEFRTDGTPVLIKYVAGSGPAVVNAFILEISEPNTAYGPQPGHESGNACPNSVLTWQRGKHAVQHDLYFGTDYGSIRDATTDVDPNNVYIGRQDACEYDPPALLDFDQTYYWRVDEVNGTDIWPGTIWSFTTEDGKAREPSPQDLAGSRPLEGLILSWTPSCLAVTHDLYFGTDFDDVNDANTTVYNQTTEPSFDPGTLLFGTKYYWRVDEVGASTFVSGDVWSFQTIGYPLMYFKFDGVEDTNLPDPITDDTGNVTFDRAGGYGSGGDIKYGPPNPLYNTGGTSAAFAGALSRAAVGDDLLDLASPAYTIEAWVMLNSWGNNIDEDEFASTIVRKYDASYILAIGDDGAARFAHAGDDNVTESLPGTIELGEWYHVAAVFDSNDPDPNRIQKLYIDGLVVEENNKPGLNSIADDEPVTIGGRSNPFSDGGGIYLKNILDGYIDELRIVDIALTANDFLLRGDANLAWLPRPSNYAKGVAQDVVLTWQPGDKAVEHDVYLSTDWDDVNDANSNWPVGLVYRGRQDPCEYDPPTDLALDTTYYWRIDEVNDNDPCVWKGTIWRFTTANYIIIDDFEQYDNDTNMIYYTWIEFIGGSMIDLGTEPFDPAHGGDQSMLFFYDNTVKWDGFHYWSEVELPFDPAKDFTANNETKVLTLYFYGHWNNDINDTEQMYVGLTGSLAEVWYTDMNDLRLEEWTEWNIPISDFNSPDVVDPCVVTGLLIGFGDRDNTDTPGGGGTDPTTLLLRGLVYFDDIWLYPPRCMPEKRKPAADLSNNCIVDWADIRIIGAEWLKHDLDFRPPQAPNDANLVGHWKLDDNADDSSIYANHGVADGNYAYVPGKIGPVGPNSIEFSGDGGRVLVPDAPELTPASQVTVAAWVNPTEDQDESARVVVKGADNKETYAIQMSDTKPDFMVRDPCGEDLSVDSETDLEEDEWTHIAGSYDGSALKFYVNGYMANSEDVNTFPLFYDSNGLAIGNRSDANDKEFIGKIDDVRLYDVALSQADVVYLASETTGYIPLVSVANIYDAEPEGQKAVNLRDIAELLNSWLEKKYWPQ